MPIVAVVNGFNSWDVDFLQYELSYMVANGQTVIPIIIDSYGGEVYNAMGMIDILKSTKLPVCTMIRGKAMSAGGLLATAGTKGMRFIGELSTMMIHDAAARICGKTGDMLSNAQEMDRITKQMYSQYDKCTNNPDGTFYKAVMARGRADWFVTAQEALDLNIVDHIGLPIITSDIDLDNILLLQNMDLNSENEYNTDRR